MHSQIKIADKIWGLLQAENYVYYLHSYEHEHALVTGIRRVLGSKNMHWGLGNGI